MKTFFKDRPPPSDTEIREYFQVLKGDPKSRVFAPLALALIRRGRLSEAEGICRLGLEANPDFSDGHLAYASVLFSLFRYEEALNEVKVTIGVDQDHVEAYLLAAEIFSVGNQGKAATEACLKAIDLDPDNTTALTILERIGVKGKTNSFQPDHGSSFKESFKAAASTAPAFRVKDTDLSHRLSDPFQQLIQAAQHLHSKRENGMELFPPGHSSNLEPLAAPDHPQTSQTPADPSARSVLGQGESTLQFVDRVQAIIDSYADQARAKHLDDLTLKVPRSGRVLLVLGLLSLLGAVAVLIAIGLRAGAERSTKWVTEAVCSSAPNSDSLPSSVVGGPDEELPAAQKVKPKSDSQPSPPTQERSATRKRRNR